MSADSASIIFYFYNYKNKNKIQFIPQQTYWIELVALSDKEAYRAN
jgi:hypothetical protein